MNASLLIFTAVISCFSQSGFAMNDPVADSLAVEKISKMEAKLLSDVEIFQTRVIDSEKYKARLTVLEDLGQTAKDLHPLLVAHPSAETLNRVVELLAKVDDSDNDHILLDRIYDQLKPHSAEIKSAAKQLLKSKKIAKKDYTSFMESWSYEVESSEE